MVLSACELVVILGVLRISSRFKKEAAGEKTSLEEKGSLREGLGRW